MTTAHVIVVGNEKGGSGKSTIALHLAVGLMQLGFRVGVADLDVRQRSLTRYLENRKAYGRPDLLPSPDICRLQSGDDTVDQLERLRAELQGARQDRDVLIIDTPGASTPASTLAHGLADTLMTPMNDSLVDIDVLVRLAVQTPAAQAPAAQTWELLGPSHYSLVALEQRRRHLHEEGTSTDWIVLRNRIAPLGSSNTTRIGDVLVALGSRLGFRTAPGVAERVIYRELFLIGATVLDPIGVIAGMRLAPSHVTARMEVRRLLESLNLPQVAAAMARDMAVAAA